MNKIFSTGFSRSSDRQYALWDAGNLSKSLCIENIDQGSGVLFPFWDEGTKMVYIVGKVCVCVCVSMSSCIYTRLTKGVGES